MHPILIFSDVEIEGTDYTKVGRPKSCAMIAQHNRNTKD